MKKFLIVLLLFFNSVNAENHLQFFIDSALKNNLKLNAERTNQKSIKQNINISRSEFLQAFHYLVIKVVRNQQVKLIIVEQVYLIQALTQKKQLCL